MKKILVTVLSLILVLSCFACANKPEVNKEENGEDGGCRMRVAFDTFIRDSEGNEKCFWDDGKLEFDDYGDRDRQHEKSAILSVNAEYNMCFYQLESILDFTIWFDVTFTYDEEIFEITENSEEENHFILKVLQPCFGEKFYVKILEKNGLDVFPESKGFPVTITTEE